MVGDVGVPLPKSLRHAVAVSQAAAPTVAESLNAATGVLTLTLSRPKSKNAFNDTLYRDLTRALQAANSNAAVRAVVLTGAGGASW
jgi:enoyl-CoA hydratase/carnithine racemase